MALAAVWFALLAAYVAGHGDFSSRTELWLFAPAAVAAAPLLTLGSARATGVALAILRRDTSVLALALTVTVLLLPVACLLVPPLALWATADRKLWTARRLRVLPLPGLAVRCALAAACLSVGGVLAASHRGSDLGAHPVAGLPVLVGVLLSAAVLAAGSADVLRMVLSGAANASGLIIVVTWITGQEAVRATAAVALVVLVWGERRARRAMPIVDATW